MGVNQAANMIFEKNAFYLLSGKKGCVSKRKNVLSDCKGWWLQGVEGLVETSPGVRSCMIEYDQRVLPLSKLLHILLKTEQHLPQVFAKQLIVFAFAQSLHPYLHVRLCAAYMMYDVHDV